MRIKLKDSGKFFKEVLEKEKSSLKTLSKKININYSTLKKYARGELLLPQELFSKLLNLSAKKDRWLRSITKKEDNWGSVMGGKSSGPKRDMTYVRTFLNIKKYRITLDKKFCEFLGALMGDGCICRYTDWKNKERWIMTITGNKKLDKQYLYYLKKLLNNSCKLHSKYYEFANENSCRLTITNKNFSLELNKKFGFPIGEKYTKLKIPKLILKLPWNIKKLLIRGLFDTDGCVVANKREDYRYPWVTITSKDIKFLEQIKEMLKEQGYPAYITGKDVCVRGISNLKRWFKDIGSSNPRNLVKYRYFLKHSKLPARLLKNGLIV